MRNLARVITLALFVVGLLALAAPPAGADALADARALIARQAEQIKSGDVAGLKAGFTKRLQDKITEDNVKKAQAEVGKMTIDDLVASVAVEKDGGARTLKVQMKNGRTLTRLVQVDGKWLADTVWFK